nr:c-type cytochrome biogenesis protein CcsB [Actinomycetota bacterium]
MNPHIDIGLARYSDLAFTSAIVVLVLALLLLAVELAYSGSRKADARELVTAGTVSADSGRPGVVVDGPRRPVDERIGRAGVALVYVGTAMLLACIMLRGLATSRVPWGNMYEFINLTCFSGLVAAAITLRRPKYRALWAFVLLPV